MCLKENTHTHTQNDKSHPVLVNGNFVDLCVGNLGRTTFRYVCLGMSTTARKTLQNNKYESQEAAPGLAKLTKAPCTKSFGIMKT